MQLGWHLAFFLGPLLYGALIGNASSNTGLFIGYLIGAGIMILGGLAEVFFGVKAEGQSIKSIAQPLSAFTEAADVHPLLKDRLEKKAS